MARQQFFFEEQIKIAVQFGLPVVMHVRRAQDLVLKILRKHRPISGIAHAFNGSLQQAEQFIGLNCVLGFGGALTFERARQIRRVAAAVGGDALVLETDSPDISPAWAYQERNEPAELPEIANTLADLRNIQLSELAALTSANAKRIIPALSIAA
jgi:TatD DNase family protein